MGVHVRVRPRGKVSIDKIEKTVMATRTFLTVSICIDVYIDRGVKLFLFW